MRLQQLHLIEQFLGLLVIGAVGLHRLISDPPRVIKRRLTPDELLDQTLKTAAARLGTPIYLPSQSAAEDWGRSVLEPVRETTFDLGKDMLMTRSVRELQKIARARGIRNVDGRALKYARKDRLVEVLSNG